MVDQPITLRTVQYGLGLAFAALVILALVRLQSLTAAGVSLLLAGVGYASSRAVPEMTVCPTDLWRVAGIGFVIVVIGAVADARGGADALSWTAAVLAYGAGNRLRAAAIGYDE